MRNNHCSFECPKERKKERVDKDDDDLMEESIEVWKIYKLLQRMKKEQ